MLPVVVALAEPPILILIVVVADEIRCEVRAARLMACLALSGLAAEPGAEAAPQPATTATAAHSPAGPASRRILRGRPDLPEPVFLDE
jgi:hypothetical protein